MGMKNEIMLEDKSPLKGKNASRTPKNDQKQ